jgi:hypothetical protein
MRLHGVWNPGLLGSGFFAGSRSGNFHCILFLIHIKPHSESLKGQHNKISALGFSRRPFPLPDPVFSRLAKKMDKISLEIRDAVHICKKINPYPHGLKAITKPTASG